MKCKTSEIKKDNSTLSNTCYISVDLIWLFWSSSFLYNYFSRFHFQLIGTDTFKWCICLVSIYFPYNISFIIICSTIEIKKNTALILVIFAQGFTAILLYSIYRRYLHKTMFRRDVFAAFLLAPDINEFYSTSVNCPAIWIRKLFMGCLVFLYSLIMHVLTNMYLINLSHPCVQWNSLVDHGCQSTNQITSTIT